MRADGVRQARNGTPAPSRSATQAVDARPSKAADARKRARPWKRPEESKRAAPAARSSAVHRRVGRVGRERGPGVHPVGARRGRAEDAGDVGLGVGGVARAARLGVLERGGGGVVHGAAAAVAPEGPVAGGAREQVGQARAAQRRGHEARSSSSVGGRSRSRMRRPGIRTSARPLPRRRSGADVVLRSSSRSDGGVAQAQRHAVPARVHRVAAPGHLHGGHRGGAPARGQHVHVGHVARGAEAHLHPAPRPRPGGCRPATPCAPTRRRRRPAGARAAGGTRARRAPARSARPRAGPRSAPPAPRSGKGSSMAASWLIGSSGPSVAPVFWRSVAGTNTRRRLESVTTSSAPGRAARRSAAGRRRRRSAAAGARQRPKAARSASPSAEPSTTVAGPEGSTRTMPRAPSTPVAAHLGQAPRAARSRRRRP